jgi:hypothetical protein
MFCVLVTMADIQWGANYGLGSVFGHEKARVGGQFWAPRANNTIIMLISRKGGHAGGCLSLLSSRTRSQQAMLHRCARNKQCYTAVLLPNHYTTRKQLCLFLCIVLYKSLAEVLAMRQQRPEVPGAL